MKILFNPEKYWNNDYKEHRDTNDIVDYPVAEAMKDQSGNPIWDDMLGTYRTTGRTIEVTIRRGTASEFEDYIAETLLERYEFLEERKGMPKTAEKEEEPVKEAGPIRCSHCGQSFKSTVQLGMHLGAKHPEKITA